MVWREFFGFFFSGRCLDFGIRWNFSPDEKTKIVVASTTINDVYWSREPITNCSFAYKWLELTMRVIDRNSHWVDVELKFFFNGHAHKMSLMSSFSLWVSSAIQSFQAKAAGSRFTRITIKPMKLAAHITHAIPMQPPCINNWSVRWNSCAMRMSNERSNMS